MTRLPVESWAVTPRLDIPPYELNTVCPVTGETSGLEDHHIWRRSFTVLGGENRDLYWVQYADPLGDGTHQTFTVKNRVALSPEAHRRITENRAWLEYKGTDLYYYEREPSGEAVGKKLDLSLRLMEGTEKPAKRSKKKAATPAEKRAKRSYSFSPPKGEPNMAPELEELARAKFARDTGTPNTRKDIPPYKLFLAVYHNYITS